MTGKRYVTEEEWVSRKSVLRTPGLLFPSLKCSILKFGCSLIFKMEQEPVKGIETCAQPNAKCSRA